MGLSLHADIIIITLISIIIRHITHYCYLRYWLHYCHYAYYDIIIVITIVYATLLLISLLLRYYYAITLTLLILRYAILHGHCHFATIFHAIATPLIRHYIINIITTHYYFAIISFTHWYYYYAIIIITGWCHYYAGFITHITCHYACLRHMPLHYAMLRHYAILLRHYCHWSILAIIAAGWLSLITRWYYYTLLAITPLLVTIAGHCHALLPHGYANNGSRHTPLPCRLISYTWLAIGCCCHWFSPILPQYDYCFSPLLYVIASH